MKPIYKLPESVDPQRVRELSRALSLPEQIAAILVRRGYDEPAAARDFLRPRLAGLHDPWLLSGMAEAVDRLERAIDRGELILVHGDYDVDGVCGVALLVRAFRELGARVEPFVPNRLKDGYDFGSAGLGAAKDLGAGLVLTCDCGISARKTVAEAREEGIDVVVTDHHTPPAELPPATAIINPHLPNDTYPEQVLCGAGVAFKLLQALYPRRGYGVEDLYKYLDLVAIPTIADLVPLTGENRILARFGLKVLQKTPNLGLRALLDVTDLKGRQLGAGQIAFIIGPRLNAVGRMGEALRGIQLLLSDDARETRQLAEVVDAENRARQDVERATFEQAKEVLERQYDPETDRAIVLASDGWHPGVIGIVASRVVEAFYRPTVLIALEGEGGRGSGRSIPGFHLYDALEACQAHLEGFGGHRAAAGLQIRRDRVEAFREALNARASSELRPEDLSPTLHVDIELPLSEVSAEMWRFLAHFGPFGMGNPTPVFVARNVRLRGEPEVVGDDHLRLRLDADGGAIHEGIGYRLAPESEWLKPSEPVDLAFHVRLRQWQGIEYLQAQVVDVRPCEGAWVISES